MKTEVYKIQVNTREELAARILYNDTIIKEDQDTVQKATRSNSRRVVGGEVFEHSL